MEHFGRKRAANLNLELAVWQHGMMIKNGVGTEADLRREFKVFRIGCEKNYRMCQFELAFLLFEGRDEIEKDIKKSFSLHFAAVQNGFNKSYFEIGYQFYLMTQTDVEKAPLMIRYLKRASDQNCSDASVLLGNFYKEGQYVEKDEKKCASYYKKAADNDNTQGLVLFGQCLKDGFGIKREIYGAAYCYQKAADFGSKIGQYNFAKLIYCNQDVFNNQLTKAIKYFKMAAEQGAAPSLFYLAKIYINGDGDIGQDLSKGKVYLLEYFEKVPEDKMFSGSDELYHKIQ